MDYSEGSDKKRYNGGWKYGKKYGKGVMDYANGDRYDGAWMNDMKNGRGIWTSKGKDP